MIGSCHSRKTSVQAIPLAGDAVLCDSPKLPAVDQQPRHATQDAHQLISHGVRQANLHVGLEQLIHAEFSKLPKDRGSCRERKDEYQK